MKKKPILFLWDEFVFIWLFFFLDVLSKALVFGRSNWIIDSILNTQASRWMPIPLVIIMIISLFAIVACIVAYEKWLIPYWSFVLLIWGALWNFFDRILYWGVRDRINISFIPVFNIADILITIWMVIFIYHEIKNDLWKQKN